MKATMSKDGQKRFTFRISFRVGRAIIVDWLVYCQLMQETLPRSRRAIIAYIRARLIDHGHHDPLVGDEDWYQVEDERKARTTALRLVAAAFPDLA